MSERDLFDGYIPPDFESLYSELRDLRNELSVLHEELEHINKVVIPRTQTNYLIRVGVLRVELLQTQVSVMKIRRKIALLRSSVDRGEVIYEEAMNYRLDKEFKEWDDRLRHEVAQIEGAKARFSSYAESEDEEEVRAVYRQLCRKLNPEINPDQSEEMKSFWPSVTSAYASRDIFHLKALLMMSDDYPESYDLPSNIGGMREHAGAMRDKMAAMRAKLENAKAHPVFEWLSLLNDPERLAAEQGRLREEIARMRSQHVALMDMQKSLELRAVQR
jgi:hypothetical protein